MEVVTILDERESILVEELRKKCDSRGSEKFPEETAHILDQLGLLYMTRKHDKVCLIQSAALFQAAIIRKPKDNEKFEAHLQDLWSNILLEANNKNAPSNLKLISSSIRERVDEMRRDAKTELDRLPKLFEESDDDEIHQMEEQKIVEVQKLQETITNQYISIMQNLSDYCVSVLGDPPSNCQFALVGMGSIARKEITPFSDFENIIVLEEGAKNKNDYQIILEYFRWFAVTFQIVLISLGETILPSVAIPSLNDYFSSKGGWFYDSYTKCGISFDGLMPYACKTPLGRKGTKEKPSTELIKPVQEMLKYLDTDTDLKDGYHLADILTTTCFVSGNRSVYEEFAGGVNEILDQQRSNKEELFSSLLQQVKKDINAFDMLVNITNLMKGNDFNVKHVMYRSTTIFVSACKKYYALNGSSCFEIIRDMQTKKLISDDFTHRLNYAVSIACEVRLKVYMERQTREDWIGEAGKIFDSVVKEIEDAVGEKSAVDYFLVAWSLQCALPSFTAEKMDEGLPLKRIETPENHFVVLFYLHKYQQCINLSKKHLKKAILSNKNTNRNWYVIIVGLCHFFVKDQQIAEKEFESYLREVAFTDGDSKLQATANCIRIIDQCLNLVEVLFEKGASKVKDFSSLFLDRRQSDNSNKHVNLSPKNLQKRDDVNAFLALTRLQSLYTAFNKSLSMPAMQIKINQPKTKPANQTKSTCEPNQNLFMNLQKKLESEYLSIKHSQASSESPTTSGQSSSLLHQEDDVKYDQEATTVHNLGKRLRKISCYEEALRFFQKEKEMRKDMDRKSKSVVKCLMEIAKCVYKLSRYEEALAQFKDVLSLYVHESVNQDCIFYIGRCLFKLKRYQEALHYLSLETSGA